MQTEYLFSLGQMMSLRRIDETIDMLLREKVQIYECAPVRYFLGKEEYEKIKGESEKVMSMSQVIESIEREAFEQCFTMTDCNYCANISITEDEQRKAGNWIPHICNKYKKRCTHESQDRNTHLIIPCDECRSYACMGFKERLTEHRCPCGRLLGKFAGQAEIKCPKCGKVNVIGGAVNE